MARQRLPKATLRAQLVAVRRAASSAALECRSDRERLRSHLTKAQSHRDSLTAAAVTLSMVEASREALDVLPHAQRDQLAIRLTALGLQAVRIDTPHDAPELKHV